MKDVNPELEGDRPIWCSEHGRWECDCEWEADLCETDPDNCWIERATGEHINATTNQRSPHHEA